MVIAADYPFIDIVGTMLVFFAWVIWIWLLIAVFGDIFRRHDIGGGAKVLWMIFVIVLPFLGVFIYLLTQNDSINERNVKQAQAQKAQFDEYVRETAVADGATGQIAKAHELLKSGAIDQAEFEQLKRRALA